MHFMCVKHQPFIKKERKRTEKAINWIMSLFFGFIFRQIFTTLSSLWDEKRGNVMGKSVKSPGLCKIYVIKRENKIYFWSFVVFARFYSEETLWLMRENDFFSFVCLMRFKNQQKTTRKTHSFYDVPCNYWVLQAWFTDEFWSDDLLAWHDLSRENLLVYTR